MTRSSVIKKQDRPVAVSTPIPIPEDRSIEPFTKAIQFHQSGKIEDAIRAYDEVLEVSPTKIAAIINKANALKKLGKFDGSMACFWQALAIQPDHPDLWNSISNTLLDMQRYEEADQAIKTALKKSPMGVDAWNALSRLLLTRKQYSSAEFCFKRILSIQPENHGVRYQLAALLLERAKLEEALQEYENLNDISPDDSSVHSGIGQVYIGLRRMKEALPYLEKALQLDSNNVDAKLGIARWHLLSGQYKNGWSFYEARRLRLEEKNPRVVGPEWDGKASLKGKTILLYAEQGFGDTIQFCRYIPILAKQDVKIIFVCQKSLVSLAAHIKGVHKATCVWNDLPAYDYYAPLLSLPHKMGLGDEGINIDGPYISSHKSAQLPPAALGTKVRVGLVWAGSPTHPDDHNRSVGLDTLLSLAGIPGVALYSLQVGPRAKDIEKLAHPALVVDFSKHLQEFADTASVIQQLDLVITVDSAVAHLAGAMGKPVWVMIPNITDWRWQLERTDSPWYPTMQLFRQGMDGDWSVIINNLVSDLTKLAAEYRVRDPEPEIVEANSIFTSEGKPRFKISAPRALLKDPGVGFLMRRERLGIGYEYATRCLLDVHLQDGDLFLDVGAHWGVMSLHAITSPDKKEITALAFEPAPYNIENLKRLVSENELSNRIEIIDAAVSDEAGNGLLRPESTMGHSLVKDPDGQIRVVTIDQILADRKVHRKPRTIVKIDVEGYELEVLRGMDNLLKSGRVAMVVWERGVEYNKPENISRLDEINKILSSYGFTSWRFESEDLGGKIVRYNEDGKTGNIVSFSAGITPLSSYGEIRPDPVKQPEDPLFDVAEQARVLFEEGTRLYTEGKAEEALKLYAESASRDRRNKDLYNNLGVMMRDLNRTGAKIACYRRALAMAPGDAGVSSNLGNALREEGAFAEARQLHAHALSLAPNNPDYIYNAALIDRDDGQPELALPQVEKALTLKPENPDAHWDRALLLMQSGDYARGFPAYESRWGIAKARKRNYPIPKWDGSPLEGRSIFIHDEQGFGDIIQFSRFIPELKKRGAGKVVFECQPELMRLMLRTEGVDAVLPREKHIPGCDVYSPLLSLPGLFGTTLETLPNAVPYLYPPEMSEEARAALPQDDRLKVGIVWAGQLIPRDRSCPLDKILACLTHPRIAPISLQLGDRTQDLKTLGADTFVTNMGPYLRDFAETSAVLNELDLLITIDTSVAHLAGALGIPTFVLLRYTSDWRWFDRIKESPWYPTLRLFRQSPNCRWQEPLDEMTGALNRIVNAE